MPTSTALILGLALLAQAKIDPDQFPLALHRSMEIDDLDREIQRLHDTVLLTSTPDNAHRTVNATWNEQPRPAP